MQEWRRGEFSERFQNKRRLESFALRKRRSKNVKDVCISVLVDLSDFVDRK